MTKTVVLKTIGFSNINLQIKDKERPLVLIVVFSVWKFGQAKVGKFQPREKDLATTLNVTLRI